MRKQPKVRSHRKTSLQIKKQTQKENKILTSTHQLIHNNSKVWFNMHYTLILLCLSFVPVISPFFGLDLPACLNCSQNLSLISMPLFF